MKILSGVHSPDEGEILLRGEAVSFASPADAKARGIGMIYQELSCMPALTVAENVFLGNQPKTSTGLIDWKRMRREAAHHLHALGIDVDVTAPAEESLAGSAATRRDLRVLSSLGPRSSCFDEPTSALSGPEAERLFAVMDELKRRGTSLVFISHFLEDVLAISDRVTVLKNSRQVATLPKDGLDKHRLIQLMIGRDAEVLAESYEGGVTLPPALTEPPVLIVETSRADGRVQRRLVRRTRRRDPGHVRRISAPA